MFWIYGNVFCVEKGRSCVYVGFLGVDVVVLGMCLFLVDGYCVFFVIRFCFRCLVEMGDSYRIDRRVFFSG